MPNIDPARTIFDLAHELDLAGKIIQTMLKHMTAAQKCAADAELAAAGASGEGMTRYHERRKILLSINMPLHAKHSAGIPSSYSRANWRGTTPVDSASEQIGFSLTTKNAGILRVCLPLPDAVHLAESISSYHRDHAVRSHSMTSDGIPRLEVSTPEDGEKVCPPLMSSAACSAEM